MMDLTIVKDKARYFLPAIVTIEYLSLNCFFNKDYVSFLPKSSFATKVTEIMNSIMLHYVWKIVSSSFRSRKQIL